MQKKRNAFTLIETLMVMLIMIIVIGLILFIILFVFNTMDKLHFHLHTISLYENINSKLEDVFSLWYFEEGTGTTVSNQSNMISFTTRKLVFDDNNWLQATPTTAIVNFSRENHSIRVNIDNASETIFSHEYLHNLEFAAGERIIYSTVTFTNPKSDATNVKLSKYRTIN